MLSKPKTILLAGDSFVEGVGDDDHGGWARRVQNLLEGRANTVIRGYGGDTIRDLRRRLQTELTEIKPDILVVAIGTNDSRRRGSPEGSYEVALPSFTDDYEDLIASALERSGVSRVVAVGLPRVNEKATTPYKPGKYYRNADLRRYDEAIRNLGTDRVLYVPIDDFIDPNLQPDSLADGLHPSPQGHRKIADKIKDTLEQLLESSEAE